MKNDLNGMTLPTCEICVNGQKRKLYGKNKNKVYLHNGDNFQLKFFNPLQERIGAQLNMNGQKIDNDLMVLNPGQEITIERYIGTNRKLTFSAYDIDTTNMSEERIKDAKKAVEKNGVLEIIFWNEKLAPKPPEPIHTTKLSKNSSIEFYDGSIKIGEDEYTMTDPSASSGIFGSIDYAPQELSRGIVSPLKSKKIETGRIEKGEVSYQHFTPISFEIGIPFYKMKFKLLPFSLKPLKKKSMTLVQLKIS